MQGQATANANMNKRTLEQNAHELAKNPDVPLAARKASVVGTKTSFLGGDGKLKKPRSAAEGKEEEDDRRGLGLVWFGGCLC